MIPLPSLIIFDTIWQMAKSHVRDIRKYKKSTRKRIGLKIPYYMIGFLKFEQCFL
jgi:hypothetical protein